MIYISFDNSYFAIVVGSLAYRCIILNQAVERLSCSVYGSCVLVRSVVPFRVKYGNREIL